MRARGLAVIVWMLGCGALPGGSDGGSSLDVGPRSDQPGVEVVRRGVDTDRDGLCDDTEARHRTDPANADTDGDGLIDSYEVAIGSNPLSAMDPPADSRLTVTEAPDAVTSDEIFLDYQGQGSDVLIGSVQDRVPGVDGRQASQAADFTVEAVSADPSAFVLGMMDDRFVGVTGRTTLHWRMTARLPPAERFTALGCRRSYQVLFLAKRVGMDVVFARLLLLDVVPPHGTGTADAGGVGDAGVGVSPDGLCLPAPPCM